MYIARLRLLGIALIMVALAFLSACQPVADAAITPTSTTLPHGNTLKLNPTESNTVPTPNKTVPITVNHGDLNGVQIRMWHPWTGATLSVLRTLVDQFNQQNEWGIHVMEASQGSSGSLYSTLKTSIVQDEVIPNLIVAPIDQVLAMQQDGLQVVNLHDYVYNSQWGLKAEELADIPTIFLNQDTIEGIQLALPAQRNAAVLFYNQSWARELGFPNPPETMDDFKQQSCAAARALMHDNDKQNDGLGGWIVNAEALTILSWMKVFGVSKLPDVDISGYQFQSAPARNMFKYFGQLFDEGCIWNSRNPEPYDYFAKRQALFYSATVQDVMIQAEKNRLLQIDDEWTILTYPVSEKKPVVLISGPSYAIASSTPEQQLASWIFVRWMLRPDNQTRIVMSSASIPVSAAAVNQLSTFGQKFPAWQQSISWIPIAQPAPRGADWRLSRGVLEDSFWQYFQPQPTPQSRADPLLDVDQTIKEILEKQNHE